MVYKIQKCGGSFRSGRLCSTGPGEEGQKHFQMGLRAKLVRYTRLCRFGRCFEGGSEQERKEKIEDGRINFSESTGYEYVLQSLP